MPPALKTDKERLSDAMQYISQLQGELTAFRRGDREDRKEEWTREYIRREIMNIMARDPEPPKWVASAKATTGERGIPTTLWTDWHIGETVTREGTNGLNEFNLRVAKRRVHALVENTIELSHEHMGRAQANAYPGAVVMLGGDMITGNIHPDLTVTNEFTNQQQINATTDLLAGALDRMATKFGKLFVPAVTGNHPRDQAYSRRIPAKMRAITSHEWVIYCNLIRHFAKSKHIQFLVPGGTDAIFSVVGHRYLLTHGDSNGVKGGDGIIGALGPIARGALKVHDSEAQVGVDVDTIVMGHWHTRVDLDHVIVSPSLIGYNEHGRVGLRVSYSRPAQLLWFTHPRHGITARWTVYLEEKLETHKRSDAWVKVFNA